MVITMTDQTCESFIQILASSQPVPGGGGASALVGAVGMALGSMVGNLTLGKKKYVDVQEDIQDLLAKAEVLQRDLLALVQRDAAVFEPLSKAYGLPRETEEQKAEKERVMEAALKEACSVPVEIMEKAMECITLHEAFCEKGTAIAISDVGVGVEFVKAALKGASLNVFINTKLMKDTAYAGRVNQRAEEMLAEGCRRADEVYNKVEQRIR